MKATKRQTVKVYFVLVEKEEGIVLALLALHFNRWAIHVATLCFVLVEPRRIELLTSTLPALRSTS